ncbi:alpha-ribazole phosphatase family protein [Ferribacterium limneticum]|uniref:alpha-ribazole phosphatase family protein n=1 Tax=Ferribacterium limneticum TaxID=76259 RepID=UPI001CFB2C61|nr:alpha-ribazole phosphatase family protein [Ferribacterium limneticum]UCV28690.1 alpha-ribazole phosphatase family protein [Ferribacterium limneticum]UCV32607.1 alpha-ribazole phosphatase family protein [Ferribacterium limneticum]
MRLHLIRHPKPVIESGVCYGRHDCPAEDVVSVAGALLVELPPGLAVWSSPLRRCRELADRLHVRPIIDTRLAEMDFGLWEGRLWDEIPRAELDAWAADVAGYAPPGGESPRQLQRRALDFVDSLDVPEAVIVTHAGVIRTLLAHWQGLPPERWTELSFAYGSCAVIDIPR